MVSGTMKITQRSWRIIMIAKKAKMKDGEKAPIAIGKKRVRRAAKTQWVAEPSD